jgi:phosphoribosylformylglycinamidine synthase
VLRIPIKHGEGAFFAAPALLEELERKRQIVLRYCRRDGSSDAGANPNGSTADVAGIVNERGNVFGLMPHPEHAVEQLIGGVDGRVILESLVDAAVGGPIA